MQTRLIINQASSFSAFFQRRTATQRLVQANLFLLLLINYMMCDFSATRHEGGDVSLDGQVVVQKGYFSVFMIGATKG